MYAEINTAMSKLWLSKKEDECKIMWRSWLRLTNPKRVGGVDAKFCPGYYAYFSFFRPRAHLWRVSNLGLEPCHFPFIYSGLLSRLN